MSCHLLDPVFRPRAVAVVGASSDPRKRGFQAVRALQESGFGGGIHPVHPRGGELLGLPVATSLEAISTPVDLALVCTPAATAPEVVRACGRAGIPAAVLLAVGFRESGADGEVLEAAVAEAGREAGVRLVGPNTSGLLNLPLGLNLIGARGVRPGPLGVLVQSGNLALNLMLDATRRSGTGISLCVGVGNELDLGFPDFLDFLAQDESTRAILVHAEGFRRGPEFVRAVAAATRHKPVVMLKAARSPAAESAARSHTGAVAGRHEVLRAALRQAGVIEVRRSDELFHVGDTLASQPSARPGTGVAILSDGGGQGTLAIDVMVETGVPRAGLAPATRAGLRRLLGTTAAVDNPVDLAGAADTDPRRFADALDLLVADPAVGALLVVGLFGGYGERFEAGLAEVEAEAAHRMATSARAAGRGLVVHTMYAPLDSSPLRALRERTVPVIESLEVACRCVGALIERGTHLASPSWNPQSDQNLPEVTAASPLALSEPEARCLMMEMGLAMVPARLARRADEAVQAATALGGTVVLKVVAEGIVHKSDAGGVRLGLADPLEVARAFDEICEAARRWQAEHGLAESVTGVLVSPLLPQPIAEILVGGHRDPQVGSVITVGAGGTWVEILSDVAIRALPLRPDDPLDMLSELRLAPVLRGVRGAPSCHLPALVAAVRAMARLLSEHAEVAEAEVNPLFAYSDRAVAVDARVFVTPSHGVPDVS